MAAFYGPDKAKEILGFIQEKQQNERDLAANLVKTFETTPALINTLRSFVDTALGEMITLCQRAADASILLNKAVVLKIDEERKRTLKVLQNYKGPPIKTGVSAVFALEEIREGVATFTPATCAEIIRLYGTIIEEVAKGAAKEPWAKSKAWSDEVGKLLAGDDALRKEFVAFVEEMDKGKGKAGEEILKAKKLDKLRVLYRTGTADMSADDLWKAGRQRFMRSPKLDSKAQKDFEDARARWGVGGVQAALDALAGGQSLFALKEASIIGRIDHLFGLVPSSDISGTTTDTMFFFKQLDCGDPIFRMLPLGPIVAGGHHSFVECAIPLSLNNICNYSIGKYTTAISTRGKLGRNELTKVLETAEKDKRNRRMVIAYDGKTKPATVQGCWVFNDGDKNFSDFAHWEAAVEFCKKEKGDPEGWYTKEFLEKVLKDRKMIS